MARKKNLNDGRYLTREAEKAGLYCKNGKGDHVNVYAPVGRGYMTIPQRELGTGLACAIRKWLIAAGVTFLFVCGFLIIL